jgi:4-diphosphocytidyl-2-C-methyl-D-erythritol kinase
VGDRLTFSNYDGFLLDVTGPFVGDLDMSPQDNLVYRAARLLAEAYAVPLRGRVTLEKNLPVAAGIGGGSSDAAMALKGFARLWGLPHETARLEKLAAQLGADVPACLVQRPLWAEGIGEKMTWLQGMPVFHLLLVNPLQAVSTPEVFRRLAPRFTSPIQPSGRRRSFDEWVADLSRYRNDLTEAAAGVAPVIRAVLRAIAATPNCRLARLSGSGATCFGLYGTAEAAAAAANKLRQDNPDWWVAATRTI